MKKENNEIRRFAIPTVPDSKCPGSIQRQMVAIDFDHAARKGNASLFGDLQVDSRYFSKDAFDHSEKIGGRWTYQPSGIRRNSSSC